MRINPSQYIDEKVIDFERYLQGPAEAAKVKPASHWRNQIVDRFHNPSYSRHALMPWSKTHTDVQLRPKEVSIWAGINGHGKSLVISQIILGVMSQSEKACIASFEMPPEKTLDRMTRQFSGMQQPSISAIDRFVNWTENKLWIYDQQGTVKSDRVLAVIRYAAEELGITHFVVDSLMKCGLPSSGDSAWNAQKQFIDQLCAVAKDTGIHIHLVAHSRKGETENHRIDKMDVAGSADITNQVDNVFMVWRNKPKEYEAHEKNPDPELMQQPDMYLACSKQRHGEWEGAIKLWFDKPSMQYVAYDGAGPIDFLRGEKDGI